MNQTPYGNGPYQPQRPLQGQPPAQQQPMGQMPVNRPPTGQPPQPAPQPRKGRGLKTLLGLMALLVVVGIVLHSTLFRIRTFQVYGNVNLSAEEVVIQSGLARGQNIFSVDKEQVERRINENRYLKFQSLRREYPDMVTLVVYERVPCATFQSLGVQYAMDKTCMILEQTEQLTPQPDMIRVTGLQVDQAHLGRTLSLRKEDQLRVCQNLLYEIESQGLMTGIAELNVSDLDNLYLVSVDGFSIRLAGTDQIRAKLISYTAAHEKLVSDGLSGGTIDVSSPVFPTYIP